MLVYVYWPSNKKRFERAAASILHDDDRPWPCSWSAIPRPAGLTTGHEWNGITELNTPVPRLVWFFLIVTVLFSVGYWVLMPALPLGSTFTKGLLGADDRAARHRLGEAGERPIARRGPTRSPQELRRDRSAIRA